jgi:sugar phosphate isomerase/epimerase
MIHQLPFRVGTTSYIVPDEILPNVRYLSGKARDVELVLFEVDDGPNNLPDAALQGELRGAAEAGDLSYTVHLPLDLRLGDGGDEGHVSLLKARRVIECTRSLQPWAYVLHLDGREVLAGAADKAEWERQAARALAIAAEWAGGEELLAVENLDNYPPDFWDGVLERSGASCCIDIGHLWKDGHDPLPYLEKHLSRARVLHIHGIAERDHKSLRHVPPRELARVLGFLAGSGFTGVMTIEVFGEEDFLTSMQAVRAALGGEGD